MLTTNRVLNELSDLATVGLSQGEILAKKTVRRQVSMLHILLIVLTLAKWQCCTSIRHRLQLCSPFSSVVLPVSAWNIPGYCGYWWIIRWSFSFINSESLRTSTLLRLSILHCVAHLPRLSHVLHIWPKITASVWKALAFQTKSVFSIYKAFSKNSQCVVLTSTQCMTP